MMVERQKKALQYVNGFFDFVLSFKTYLLLVDM